MVIDTYTIHKSLYGHVIYIHTTWTHNIYNTGTRDLHIYINQYIHTQISQVQAWDPCELRLASTGRLVQTDKTWGALIDQ